MAAGVGEGGWKRRICVGIFRLSKNELTTARSNRKRNKRLWWYIEKYIHLRNFDYFLYPSFDEITSNKNAYYFFFGNKMHRQMNTHVTTFFFRWGNGQKKEEGIETLTNLKKTCYKRDEYRHCSVDIFGTFYHGLTQKSRIYIYIYVTRLIPMVRVLLLSFRRFGMIAWAFIRGHLTLNSQRHLFGVTVWQGRRQAVKISDYNRLGLVREGKKRNSPAFPGRKNESELK